MERRFDYIKFKKDLEALLKKYFLAKKFFKGVRIQKEHFTNFKNYTEYSFFHCGNTVAFSMMSVKLLHLQPLTLLKSRIKTFLLGNQLL